MHASVDRQIEDDRQIDYIYVYIYVYTYTRVYSRLYFLLQEKIRYKLLGREREKKKERSTLHSRYMSNHVSLHRETRIASKQNPMFSPRFLRSLNTRSVPWFRQPWTTGASRRNREGGRSKQETRLRRIRMIKTADKRKMHATIDWGEKKKERRGKKSGAICRERSRQSNRRSSRFVTVSFKEKKIIFHAFFNLVFPSNFESVSTDI